MKKMICLLLGALMVLTMAACGSQTATQVLDPEGDKMVYADGDEVVVMLRGNPTTGYEWFCTGGAEGCVSGGEEYEYEQDEAEDGMVGVGGIFTFRFAVEGAGTTTLHFSYERSWEEDSSVDSYDVTVNVDERGNVEIEG